MKERTLWIRFGKRVPSERIPDIWTVTLGEFGTAFAKVGCRVFQFQVEETVMGNRAIWAVLFVLGVPLPLLVIMYLLTGGGCN
jgi:hypothetical protein